MHGHFPNPHPDELLYGVCARLSERANVPSKKGFCESLFGAGSIAVIDLPSRLGFLADQLPLEHLKAEALLQNHTLLPLYLAFLPKARAEKCKQAALGDGGKSLPFLTGIMPSKIEQPANLRLCPICADEDKKSLRRALLASQPPSRRDRDLLPPPDPTGRDAHPSRQSTQPPRVSISAQNMARN